MTSPLQQKIKITGPSIVTANRTRDFAVTAVVEQELTASWDYAIVRLAGSPGRTYGHAQIAAVDPPAGSTVVRPKAQAQPSAAAPPAARDRHGRGAGHPHAAGLTRFSCKS